MTGDHDRAMLWLHDRFGEWVELVVTVHRDDSPAFVVVAEGELSHWRTASSSLGAVRDDLAGQYKIGDVEMDVTSLGGLPVRMNDLTSESVTFELAAGVDLTVTMPTETDTDPVEPGGA